MKTSVTQAKPKFKPVSLTITFETQKELDAFASAMNHCWITESIQSVGDFKDELLELIARPLSVAGADMHVYIDELSKKIKSKAY